MKYLLFCVLLFLDQSTLAQELKNLTLQEAMDLAEEKSFDVKTSESSLSLAQKSKTLSYFSLTPTFSVNDIYSIYPQNMQSNINQNASTNRLNTFDLKLIQPVSGLGQSIYKIRQMSALKNGAQNDLLAARIQARLNAAKDFLQTEQSKQTCEIDRAAVLSTKKQYEDTKILFETGEANKTKVDLLTTQSTYLKAENELTKCDLDYTNSLADLKNKLGEEANNNFSIKGEDGSNFESSKLTLPPLDYFIDSLQDKKAEIKSLQNQLDALSHQQAQNTFNYFPQLNLIVDYNETSALNSMQNNDLNNYESNSQKSFYYGVNFTWNIWDGGIIAQNTFNYIQQKEGVNIKKDQLLRDAKTAVEKAYHSIKTYLLLLKTSQGVLKSTQEAYQLATIQYKIGVISATDLADQQKNLTDAKIDFIKTKINVDLSWLQLQSAAGILPEFN